ncbi:hypothetical protein AMEX_G19378 [Astyanax mexicanus]|uniref:Uncharacterized protein n=1 Tax=Astyanax mexicanus TaxID=7994 RepID=A0A8T2L453_ASTMX|nr:hypothetical protein AMEX_G19378 [Astyanax mexicanus]
MIDSKKEPQELYHLNLQGGTSHAAENHLHVGRCLHCLLNHSKLGFLCCSNLNYSRLFSTCFHGALRPPQPSAVDLNKKRGTPRPLYLVSAVRPPQLH